MKFKTVFALSIFVASCSGSDQGSSSQSIGCSLGDVVRDRAIKIATTVAPITSIVANIAGGSSAIITGIVPEG
ncbi:MAG: hypothetical protein ACKO73_01025, partial [Acidimicrobiaceae bacterium]